MINAALDKLRALLKQYEFDGYLISTMDEFLSEYAPECAKRLEYITGFTGSNGFAIIKCDIVLFFTDGRYLTQARSQLQHFPCEIFDVANIIDFDFEKYFPESARIGYDPKIFTSGFLRYFRSKYLVSHQQNLIDVIWENRPASPASAIYDYDIKYAGESRESKIEKCRKFLENNRLLSKIASQLAPKVEFRKKSNDDSSILITDPSAVCWLLNIRGHDIEFSPLVLCYAIVTFEDVILFCDSSRFAELIDGISVISMDLFEKTILDLDGKILFDPNYSSSYIKNLLNSREHQEIRDPCQMWKAVKNDAEIKYMIEGHIEDAVAVIECLAFIDERTEDELSRISEYDIGKMLTEFRSKGGLYVMDSFPTICGYQENGAIIHYRAEQNTAKTLVGQGLLLMDSGGQYLGATTDVTRTISIGEPTLEQIHDYTNILKGHIDLALAKFPKDKLAGSHLDALASSHLWKDGKDYAHGTGHGVGSFLSVHEGPHNISANGYVKIAPGMVMSNEPGYYKVGQYGIRIENMMFATASFENQDYTEFEMLTLVPYCKNLIDESMLDITHKEFLTRYYRKISKLIAHKLSKNGKNWLNNEIEVCCSN